MVFVTGVGSLAACAGPTESLTLDEAVEALDIDAFLGHMAALSSDAMAGRQPGTPGYDSAATYIVREARSLGLEPGGVDGTFLQPIVFRRATLNEGSTLHVGDNQYDFGQDFSISARVLTSSTRLTAPLAFAGYGISAPDLGYDDFEDLDVRGKIVLVVEGAPAAFGSLERTVLSSRKVRDAELVSRGALGVALIQSTLRTTSRPTVGFVPPAQSEAGATRDAPETSSGELGASLTVREAVAAEWLSRAGHDLADITRNLEAGVPTSFDIGAEITISADFTHETFESANVAAIRPGTDPLLRDEYLVVTAHLDHLGIGTSVAGDSIYNGTLDNASGSAAILSLATTLTQMPPPRRSVLFLWVTAEESGMLGSEYFARFPSLPTGRVVANQNMDGVMGMIAAATDVLAFGYEHSNLSEPVDFAVARTGTPVSPDPTPEENLFVRSDQYAFVREGIPAIWVQAGRSSVDPTVDAQGELDQWIVDRYHKPTDDGDQPVDLLGVRYELENNLLVLHHIANELDTVQWDTESFLYRRWGRR